MGGSSILYECERAKPAIDLHNGYPTGMIPFLKLAYIWTFAGTILGTLSASVITPVFYSFLNEELFDRNVKICMYAGVSFVLFFISRVLLHGTKPRFREQSGKLVTYNRPMRYLYFGIYCCMAGVCMCPFVIWGILHYQDIMIVLQMNNIAAMLALVSFCFTTHPSRFMIEWGLACLCMGWSWFAAGVYIMFYGVHVFFDTISFSASVVYCIGALLNTVIMCFFARLCIRKYQEKEPDHLILGTVYWFSTFYFMRSIAEAFWEILLVTQNSLRAKWASSSREYPVVHSQPQDKDETVFIVIGEGGYVIDEEEEEEEGTKSIDVETAHSKGGEGDVSCERNTNDDG